jgi:hypothetical protein
VTQQQQQQQQLRLAWLQVPLQARMLLLLPATLGMLQLQHQRLLPLPALCSRNRSWQSCS